MTIGIYNDSSQSLGGGFRFIENFMKGVQGTPIVDYDQADVILIPSPSMVYRTDPVVALKEKGKKIVLRVDNIVRDSRNRGAGMSRMKSLSEIADEVVYQSEWSRNLLKHYLKREGVVIYNGVDTSIFSHKGAYYDSPQNHPVYLYSRFNRDEGKNWFKVYYRYIEIQREQPEAKLMIVGQFSPEVVQYNFDFFDNENIEYKGVIDSPAEMAKLYRSADYLFAPYYNDCYSNTYQEALACGCELFEPDMSGGTPELIKNGVINCERMVEKYKELFSLLLKGGVS